MKIENKFKVYFLMILWLLICLIIPAVAISEDVHGNETFNSEFETFFDSIPEEVDKYLNDYGNIEDNNEKINSIFDSVTPENAIDTVFEIIEEKLSIVVKMLAVTLGLVISASVLNALKNSIASSQIGESLSYCTDILLISAFVSSGISTVDTAMSFNESLNRFITGIIPVTASLYAAGGNIQAGAASSASFMMFLGVSNLVCSKLLKVICSVLIALSLCSTVAPSLKLSSLSAFIKKAFATSLSFIMMIMIFAMTAQNTFSSARDGIAARTAKFFVGNMIPIVGGSVSDTIRTLSTNISFIRKTLGMAAIIIIVIMFIPHLMDLILKRAAMLFCGTIADILGCDRQSLIIREMAGIYGNILAVTSICTISFIFSLALFAYGAVAIGGA